MGNSLSFRKPQPKPKKIPILKVSEASTEIDVRSGISVTTAKLAYKQSHSLKLKHAAPGFNMFSAELRGPKWGALYNPFSKDLELDYTANIKPGELKIRQRVPQGKWELIPTPEIKLTSKVLQKGRVKDQLEATYDMLTSTGRLKESLTFSNKHTFTMEVDSKAGLAGAVVSAKSSVGKRFAKLVGVSYSKPKGPTLLYDLELYKRALLQTEANVLKRTLSTKLTMIPADSSRSKVTFEARFNDKQPLKPVVLLGGTVGL